MVFSSLWPFSTLGWPEQTKEFKKYALSFSGQVGEKEYKIANYVIGCIDDDGYIRRNKEEQTK